MHLVSYKGCAPHTSNRLKKKKSLNQSNSPRVRGWQKIRGGNHGSCMARCGGGEEIESIIGWKEKRTRGSSLNSMGTCDQTIGDFQTFLDDRNDDLQN